MTTPLPDNVQSPSPAPWRCLMGWRSDSAGVRAMILGWGLLLAQSLIAAPLRHSLDRAPLPPLDESPEAAQRVEGLMAVMGIDREIYLEATVREGEDFARLARRLCGDAAAAEAISQLNQIRTLEPGAGLRVPLALLDPELQMRTVRALFPQDRLRAGHWEHWVQNGSRRGLETAWRIARWFTGDGENATRLAEVNGFDGRPLGAGRIVRLPQELLLPGLHPGMNRAEAAAELAETLEYLYDGTGLHAVYRMRPGEAVEAALRRLTRDRDDHAMEVMTAEIASLNGIDDPLALPVGFEIKIPAGELRPELRAPDQLWLPTPVAQPGVAGSVGWHAASSRDFLIGLGVAAPHEITNLQNLLGSGGESAFAADPHGGLEPGRGRVSPRLEVAPSEEFPELDVLPYSVWVGGRRLGSLTTFADRESGVVLLPFAEVAAALGHRFRLDAARRYLVVERAPDGAALSLNMATGLVIANRRAAGVAPDIAHARLDPLLLPIEATEAMTGAHIERDDERHELRIELDQRLRSVFGFEVVVEGQPLLFLDPEPRAVGSVLLLPLQPIAEALGDELIVDQATRTVRVIRAQDNATIVLELATGVVRVNDWAAGMVPNMPYADTEALLLPQAAVEALTGTHVTVQAGTRRISADLDPRLRGLLAPRGDLWAEVRDEGFVAERLDLRLGNDMPNEIRLRSRFRELDLDLRYETAGFPDDGVFDPLWADLRFESLRGFGGILGDYSASRRELRGVDLSRIRGAVFRQDLEGGGELRLVAGQPLRGSRRLDERLSVPTFDDLAVGARYYAPGGRLELGVAGLDDDDGREVVASLLHRWDVRDTPVGDFRSQEELDLGSFDGDLYDRGGGQSVDLRASWNGFLRPSEQFSVAAQARYIGLQFNRMRQAELRIDRDAREGLEVDPITGQPLDNDDRELERELGGDTDRLDVRVNLAYQPVPELSLGARTQWRQDGLFEGATEDEGDISSWGVNLSTQPFARGPRLAIDYGESRPDGALAEDQPNEELRIDLSQRIGRFQLVAQHEEEKGDGQRDRELTSLSLRARPWRIPLPKDAAFLVSPGVRAFRTDDLERADVDLFAELRSGHLFGNRFDVRLAYARSLAVELDKDLAGERDDDYQETLSAVARYRVRDDLAIEASYIDNLRTGDDRFLVRLRAGIDFSPPRKYKLPNEGTGVLTGFAFLDSNQDGIYQPGEPALPGVGVWIRGRRLGLETDRLGRFTIQNLRAGPYQLEVDLDNLPIGLLPYREELPRLAVGNGEITHLEIPMILSGQVRGSLFEDRDGNGTLDPGERGLEGVKISLRGVEPGSGGETYTTFFGQFAFDRLRAGRYRLEVDDEFLPPGWVMPAAAAEVVIDPATQLMQRVEIALRPLQPGGTLLAEEDRDPADPNPTSGTRRPPRPAERGTATETTPAPEATMGGASAEGETDSPFGR